MRFNVAQQLKEEVGATRTYQFGNEVSLAPEEGWGPFKIEGSITMLKTDRGILVRGALHTEKGEVCSRCLEPYHELLSLEISEEFFPVIDVGSGLPLNVPEDAEPFAIDRDCNLDLGEAIRQAILLASPMKPVCQPDCGGLCIHCGQNLNEGNCGCEKMRGDGLIPSQLVVSLPNYWTGSYIKKREEE